MRKRILVVDDSETVLGLTQLILRHDYDVITATDGKAALTKARAELPDLVVLDLVMPGMSGAQVCRALRSTDGTKQTPIVMLSSQSDVSSRRTCYVSGCSAFLPKPVDGPRLLAQVKSLLDEQNRA